MHWCSFHFNQKPLPGKQSQALMAFLIPNQLLATLLKEASLKNIQSISHALISTVLMDQITHACHYRLKNVVLKDTISLHQKHCSNPGQATANRVILCWVPFRKYSQAKHALNAVKNNSPRLSLIPLLLLKEVYCWSYSSSFDKEAFQVYLLLVIHKRLHPFCKLLICWLDRK